MLPKARFEIEKRESKEDITKWLLFQRGNGGRSLNRVGKVRKAYQKERKRGLLGLK